MEAKPEVFFNRVPGSNVAVGGGIVFTPDPMNPSLGRYETSDPREIAELKAAIKSGAPTLFQDVKAEPYAKSADPVEAAKQQAAVDQEQKKIEQNRDNAAAALARKRADELAGAGTAQPTGFVADPAIEAQKSAAGSPGAAAGIPSNQTQGVGGIVNTSALNSNAAPSNGSPSVTKK